MLQEMESGQISINLYMACSLCLVKIPLKLLGILTNQDCGEKFWQFWT